MEKGATDATSLLRSETVSLVGPKGPIGQDPRASLTGQRHGGPTESETSP
jgi:hypothetical protein